MPEGGNRCKHCGVPIVKSGGKWYAILASIAICSENDSGHEPE